MQYTAVITPYEHYIHVQVSGSSTYANALELWQRIVAACEKHNCYNILGEQNLLNPLSTMEAFDHPALFKKAGVTSSHRIAWVDKNPNTMETTAFIRDVLSNRSRGYYGRLFNNTDAAKTWLLSHT